MNRRTVTAAGLALALGLVVSLSACGSSTTSAGKSTTLTIGAQQGVPSLNPVLSPISNTLTYAYDPLIFKADDGSYHPDLATKWGYVGTGNLAFEFTLRSGATFARGEKLDAASVVKSIEYFLKTPNSNMASVGKIKDVKAVGDDTVHIDYAAPFPNAVDSLTQFYGMGLVIGPDGVADPGSLSKQSDGVGQYKLDSSKTTASAVVFNANTSYFNPDAVKFDQIRITVLGDANARLSALKSGQIDIAQQIPVAQVGSKQIAGFQKVSGYTNWSSIQFLNASSGPLASTDVRRALQYAIDRPAIVSDFYQGLALPQVQAAPVGTVGYDKSLDSAYSYDPAKAKQLLAQAGYPQGFSLRLLTNSVSDQGGLLSQVVVGQLAKVGITAKLTVASGTFDNLISQMKSGKYDAILYGLFATDLYSAVTQSILSPGTLLNPDGKADAQAQALIEQAAAASSTTSFASILEQLNAYMTTNALQLPIATTQSIDLVANGVKVPSTSYTIPQPTIVAPDPALEVSK